MSAKEKAAHDGGSSYRTSEDDERIIAPATTNVKRISWIRELELALDAAREAESGDRDMMARNLIEAASLMLTTALEIKRSLRQ